MTEHQIILVTVGIAAAFVLGYVVRSLLLLLMFRLTRAVLKGVAVGLLVKLIVNIRKWPWL